ncbi:unnamed protein product [Mytilus edulis]|uniref:Uncharacterized protein n=1 Tax=Mytilus edulis TaxID=6550 RepID=A0A8S3QJH2_MYTED|nr:unnamed protein product [Mytilus edulis]
MSLNENLTRGQKVRLLGGQMGVIKGKTDNFGFPLWEIQLEGGKLVTEARYRFDIISEPDRTVTHPLEHDSPPHVPDELLYLFEPELNEVDKTPNEAPVNKVTLKKASLLATGASGASLRGIGTIEVPIEIGRLTMQQTFHIFENFTHSIILGLDFLDQQKARLNFDDKTLVLQSGITEVPLTNGDNNDNSICFISLVNDEVIPSRSEVIIPPVQTVDKSIKSKLGIIEPNPALVGKQNIVGATCLVQIRNNKTFLQVLNPTNAKVRLSKHTKIGKFSEIIENSISSEITDDTIEINSIDKGTQNKYNEAKYIEIAKSLNFNFSDSDLTTEQKQKLMVMLGTNRDVFAMNLSELGCTDLHPHRIETGDAQPVRQKVLQAITSR